MEEQPTPEKCKARALIESIFRENTLDGRIVGTRLESLLTNCLEILSNQLYEKSTHFLLELIQNADDNTYDDPNPTLSFSYEPGSLRIDCNEIGFRAENVEALCAISKSTKSGKTNDGEYIGEKGIGFKSVFKAADIVWISSREYEFQFDRTNFLGMVTPVWATFPESTAPGWTSMYLRLSKDYEEQTLRDELIAFDLHLLIFLRRIKEINISIGSRSGQTHIKTVRKDEQERDKDRIILLRSDDNTFEYIIRTFAITDLPNEPKRPNWTQTKILLAFPSINRLEKPRVIPQKIYAFLPIRNYGFKFLIQGDFLLTASREDIESTLPWNRRLRDALAEAFLESVDRFNQGDLKYVWPHYVPSTREVPSAFLAPAITSILTQLGKRPCLESCAATMVQPASMKYTSGDFFVDEEGYPFTRTSQNAHRYLSPKYPEWVVESIENLGVSKMTARDFLDDLALAIRQDPVTFYRRSNNWHSQLSVALVKISTDTELLSAMQDISLIPLQDGTWTSARGKAMFFAKNESSLEIPSGIDVLIVDSSAGLDSNRRKLFIALGVRAWEAPEICRLILKVHESSNFDPKSLKTGQLISHAAFLYNASWQPPDGADIWFATMQDDRCKGRKLYIPGSAEPNSPAGRVFAQLQKKFSVIHMDYLNAPGLGLGWPSWLVTNLGLSMVPRLIYPHVKPRPQPIAQAIQESSVKSIDAGTRPRAQGGNALPDYQMQLMLLEQQNKRRLLMARQEVVHSPPLTQVQMGMNSAGRVRGVTPQPAAPMTRASSTELLSRSDGPTGAPNVINPIDDFESFDFDSFLRSPNVINPLDDFDVDSFLHDNQSPRAAQSQDEAKIAEKAASKESKESTESSALATDTADSFGLSEEFTFMFGHCHSSDILQILKDNWTEYSQWIDGAHMKWQGSNFVKSCDRLKSDIAACSVQTAKAQLPLREGVLPMIDRHLDESYVTPSLQIGRPKDSEWSLLNHFGVLIKGDIHYYLRCLMGISGDQHLDINTIVYIYEKIDGQYKGNEEIVRAAFYERDLVYLPCMTSTSTESTGWTNMRECVSKDYGLNSEYKSCAYLFRSLLSPSGDPIAPLVLAASLISSSSKLEEIARLFCDINTAVKDLSTSRAAQLLRSLQKKPIFPVIDDCQRGTYSRLLDAHNTSWFIADRFPIRESLLGKLPLLALSVQDLLPLRDLFRALGLNDRLLSTRVTSTTNPIGRISPHWRHTENFRSKRPFITALIPPSHPDKIRIECQLHGILVNVATHISQQFSLRIADCTVKGSPTRGQVARSDAGNVLNLFITEEGASEETPPYELVNIIADACQLSDPNHRSLLHTALSSSNIRSLISAFQQQGLYIKGTDMPNSSMRYRAQRNHSLRIPSPFWGHLNGVKGNSRFLPEAMRAPGFGKARRMFHTYEDRRLPMSGISEEDIRIFGGVNVQRFMVVNEKLDNWDNLQHLGEHMFSKLLRTYLGPVYSPERHWTSEFRSRSGYSSFTNLTSCAAFALNDREVQDRMTDFVLEYGQSKMPTWSKRLQLERPVYHIDVAVNMHVKESFFFLRTAQIDRMQRLKMHDNLDEPHTDVYILVQVCDVGSEELMSIEILLDPWKLLDSNTLTIETTWFVRGALTREDSGPGKKRPKVHQPTLSWASPAIPREQVTPGPRTRRGGETYTYRPLPHGHIRLLYLLPGNTNERLHGMIFHTPYDSKKDYQSLSYVWGSDRRTHEIVTADGIVNITKSLSNALHGLRRKDKAITLWVDALCINQEDNNEKEQQIRLLPQIFQNSTFTYAFLDGAKKFEGAIEMLMQIRVKAALEEQRKALVKDYEESQSDLEDGHELTEKPDAKENSGDDHVMIGMQWPKDLRTVPVSWKDRCIPLESDSIWSSVEALFGLPWFRRVWIVQEIVASPNVQVICGKREIDWSDLHCAVEIIDRQLQLNELSSLNMSLEPFLALAAQREWEARQYRWSLIMLLEHFRYAESTLSRDRLFALLGLASDANEPAFAPDYSCSFEEVVLRFARGFVRQGRGLQLLYRAGLTQHSDRFPSWIPDWTVKRPSGLYDASESGEPFSASGPSQPNIQCEPDTNGLIADGYEVDFVQDITTSSNVNAEWGTYFDEIDEMLASAVLSPCRDSLDAIKWKVPIAGALYPKIALHGVTDLQSSYNAFRNYLTIKRKGKQVSGNRTVHERFLPYAAEVQAVEAASYQKQSTSYVAALQGILSGWKFIVTKRGYVGVVPNLTQAGDIVAVLKGSLVPFILKKSESRSNEFRLVGECYVHGVMNGEGLMLSGVVEREFCIH